MPHTERTPLTLLSASVPSALKSPKEGGQGSWVFTSPNLGKEMQVSFPESIAFHFPKVFVRILCHFTGMTL